MDEAGAGVGSSPQRRFSGFARLCFQQNGKLVFLIHLVLDRSALGGSTS